ncbi:MAG: hypothetical protein ACREXS_10820 [Gammaproteobacteria bacterium]
MRRVMASEATRKWIAEMPRKAEGLDRSEPVRQAAIDASVQSWIGYAGHADTEGLRRAIFSRIIFGGVWTERRPA